MIRQRACILLFCLVLPLVPALPQSRSRTTTINTSQLARMRARMQAFVDKGTIPGLVSLVAHRGQIVSESAIGMMNFETKAPMRMNTLFHIASMSKPITCIGVLILLDEGRLALTDPVSKYLPEFADQKLRSGARPARPVNIRDLMAHTSGMSGTYPTQYGDFFQFFHERKPTLAAAVTTFAQTPLEFEPGARWQYSNMGIATLGRIIEAVSGQAFAAFMQARVFAPLGMNDTHYFLPAEKQARVATIYNLFEGRLVKAPIDLYRPHATYPAPEAGLYSTAPDLFRLHQMTLNRGMLNGQRMLSRAAVSLMTTNHTGELKAGFVPGAGFGLGWSVVRNVEGMFRLNNIGTWSHGGLWKTYGYVDPTRELIGILLMQRNSGDGDLSDEVNAFVAMSEAAMNN
ncbi:MAG: serine hydrolase domain-containing protein [Blastocatellia bacterium]